ncbi:putative structural protein [Erwinia phage vB_EamM_TropicalSun]|uniref:Uncharacterized protein n=4 Tax=Myosmarvirus TaxID=2843428 RepID=A0A9E8G192_9CAUD|nr:baseplate hub [Serratia phage MyoSmar]QEG09509.1 hypothetical protein CPT_MyoSmar_060 [Serratia phage MyoSmar]QEG13824.1 putative structural protein [Erwinia phage vB_EamM_TropicalSun]UZS00335.1 hypothetical protein [Serratia phage SMP]
MSLKRVLVRVTFDMPNGPLVLNEELMLNINIKKAALNIQNRATIDVGGLTQKDREYLLSNFTAFNKRLVDTGQVEAAYINVKIEAGYEDNGKQSLSVIFKGQVVSTEPVSGPPNMITRITCYTRQIDKTKFVTTPAPAKSTFKEYVTWAAQQMGFGNNFICDTSINDTIIVNAGRTAFTNAALLWDIQNLYRDSVAAYVDDDFLIVKDKNKILSAGQLTTLTEFMNGPPTWTEWGVEFTVLFDPNIKLASGVNLKSIINPSLNDTNFVIMSLTYEIESRGDKFYAKAEASPAAQG